MFVIAVRSLSRLIFSEPSLQVLHMCTLATHEGGQVMYVTMPYFVLMEVMVSWLINGENIPYLYKPCCLLDFTSCGQR